MTADIHDAAKEGKRIRLTIMSGQMVLLNLVRQSHPVRKQVY